MKKGTICKIKIPNQWNETISLEAEFLGRGQFARCYRVADKVYSFVKFGSNRESDYSKEAIAEWADTDNPHVPDIKRIDSNDDVLIFSMPYYQPLTPANKTAWKQFKILEKAWLEVLYNSHERLYYLRNRVIIDSVRDLLPPLLIEALESIDQACINYGDSYSFEFAKRNLAIDQDGNLVLLDVIFNVKALKDKRRNDS